MDYEETLKELEKTVETLESGNVSLEESVKLFEKGVALTKDCLASLADYKNRIDSIRDEIAGLVPFDRS